MKVLASDMTKLDLNKWLHLNTDGAIDLSCDLQWYGGKAMNLAKLHDFGFQVPYAFAFDNEDLASIAKAYPKGFGDGIVIYYELEKWIYSICGG